MAYPLPVRAVLFDLDGTLHDRPLSLRRFIAEQYARTTALRSAPIDEWTMRFIEIDAGGLVWKDRVYQKLVDEFDIAYLWEALLADYELNFPRCAVLYSGAIETLNALRQRGFVLGLVTNGRTLFQQSVLRSLNIDGLFDVVLISEAEGVRKPEREIFTRALNKLSVTAYEAVFVGDSIEADIVGAKSANLRTIWKRNDATSIAPHSVNNCADYCIDNLSELLSMPMLSSANAV